MTSPTMNIKKLLTFVLGGVVVVGGAIFLSGAQETAPQEVVSAQKIEEKAKGQIEKTPYFSTNFAPLPSASKFGEKIVSFITKEENASGDDAQNKGTLGFSGTLGQKSTEEAKIFAIMFPEPTLRAFHENQTKLIAVGVMAESERIALTTEQEVTQYIQRRFESYLNEPSVSDEEKAVARRTIQRLPQVMRSERERAERILRGEVAEKIPSPLMSALTLAIPRAEAFWYTIPDCYKDDNPFSMVPGYTNIALCCNCGYHCSDGCAYFQDCGFQSIACNVPLGCLNLECKFYQNAIWSSLTGICGCG